MQGLDLSISEAVTTTRASYEAETAVSERDGSVAVTLPAQSITSIRLAP
ncbi:MAG: hypothetical protein H5U40_07225 [Polyangiaceae bacterium]|nr:hypothetical protein [Polyangiaceae bacterium]